MEEEYTITFGIVRQIFIEWQKDYFRNNGNNSKIKFEDEEYPPEAANCFLSILKRLNK